MSHFTYLPAHFYKTNSTGTIRPWPRMQSPKRGSAPQTPSHIPPCPRAHGTTAIPKPWSKAAPAESYRTYLHFRARNLRVDLATSIFVQRPHKHVQMLPVGSESLKHTRQSINHRLLQVHERLGEVALGGARQRKRSNVFGPAELVG